MCGRYQILDDSPKMKEIVAKALRAQPSATFVAGDLFPGQLAPILIGQNQKIYARFSLWGWYHKIINARSETLLDKALFQQHFLTHRALVPANGFYEWDQQKRPFLFHDLNKHDLYFAALYNDDHAFVIITQPAQPPVSHVHDRMPLIIQQDQLKDWLFDGDQAKRLLFQNALYPLEMQSLTPAQMKKKASA